MAPPTTSTSAPSTTTTIASPGIGNQATGPNVNYFYGTISVSVTLSNGTISNITIASLNDTGNPRSRQIDLASIPILEQEAIGAASANIASVSGATYTSQGFKQSLQGALSKLGH